MHFDGLAVDKLAFYAAQSRSGKASGTKDRCGALKDELEGL